MRKTKKLMKEKRKKGESKREMRKWGKKGARNEEGSIDYGPWKLSRQFNFKRCKYGEGFVSSADH